MAAAIRYVLDSTEDGDGGDGGDTVDVLVLVLARDSQGGGKLPRRNPSANNGV